MTLFAGFLVLILAPEFFQPLRDLGAFYHAKAQAVGGADALEAFMQATPATAPQEGQLPFTTDRSIALTAEDLRVCAPDGQVLCGPLSFIVAPGEQIALVGQSGAGKTALMNALLGFLPYQGSLKANGVELRDIRRSDWHQQLSWVGQNPQLPAATLRDNIVMNAAWDDERFAALLESCGINEFLPRLPQGIDTQPGDGGNQLSVGQAQRVAVARALYKSSHFLLLDEPAASLDALSERHVMLALNQAAARQTTLMITHQIDTLSHWQTLWVMEAGKLVQQGNWQQLSQQPGAFSEMLKHRQQEIR